MATLKKLTPKDKKLVREHLAALDAGRSKYREAEEKLNQLLPRLEIGKPYPMGNGEIFTINDEFASDEINPKQTKPTIIRRYRGVLSHE